MSSSTGPGWKNMVLIAPLGEPGITARAIDLHVAAHANTTPDLH